MTSQPKRPVSVWIAQTILGIYASFLSFILLSGLYKTLSAGVSDPELYLLTTIGSVTIVAVFVIGFVGMTMRKSWGRWVGVAALAILLVGAAIKQSSRWASETYASFLSVGFLFSVFVVVGLALLIYFIAAGDAADKFFDK